MMIKLNHTLVGRSVGRSVSRSVGRSVGDLTDSLLLSKAVRV